MIALVIATSLAAAPDSFEFVVTFDGGPADGNAIIRGYFEYRSRQLCAFDLGLRRVEAGRISIPVSASCRDSLAGPLSESVVASESLAGVVVSQVGDSEVRVDVDLSDFLPSVKEFSKVLAQKKADLENQTKRAERLAMELAAVQAEKTQLEQQAKLRQEKLERLESAARKFLADREKHTSKGLGCPTLQIDPPL